MQIEEVVKDHVLPYLPAKSLARFRSVSKAWDQRIRGPFLAHQQSYHFQKLSGYFVQFERLLKFVSLDNHAYGVPAPSLEFLPERVNIISSCNGLVLCRGRVGDNTYYVCNPVNKEWVDLPRPTYYHGSEPAAVLAFEPSVLNMEAHYQLICAVPLLDEPIVFFEIYSSQTKNWKVSAAIFLELGDASFTDNMFYMNGRAYWEMSSREVLAFDLNNEIHGIISLPPETPCGGILTQIHNELCYITVSQLSGNEYTINMCSGVELSLIRSINVRLELDSDDLQEFRVLPSLDGNTVMILIRNVIFSYSLTDQTIQEIAWLGINSPEARYLPYLNSLVQVGWNI